MAQKQAVRQKQAITLKGSTAMVTEFLDYSVNRCVFELGQNGMGPVHEAGDGGSDHGSGHDS